MDSPQDDRKIQNSAAVSSQHEVITQAPLSVSGALGGVKNKGKAKDTTSFEENLRGKFKNKPRASAAPPLEPPAPPESPATNQLEVPGDGLESIDGMITFENTEWYETRQAQEAAKREAAKRAADERRVKNREKKFHDRPEYIEYDGDSPDEDGWHEFVNRPVSGDTFVYIYDEDDPGAFLEKHGPKLPDGIYGPEGYLWGLKPEDIMYAEIAPNLALRCSLSQLRAWDPTIFLDVTTQNIEAAHVQPLLESLCADRAMLERLCGKPTIVQPIPYARLGGWLEQLTGPDRLNVFIPFHELPLTLDVFDEDDLTNPGLDHTSACDLPNYNKKLDSGIPVLSVSKGARPHKYKLVDPTGNHTLERHADQATHATLVISKSRQIGTGNSARVYEGQIGLDIKDKCIGEAQPPIARFPPKLRVVAKVGTGPSGSEFMRNEARMYNSFPEYFFREYTGFQQVKPSHFLRRVSQIVPCFYGFYEPVEENIQASEHKRAPILLMEDCGMPIDPDYLTQNQKGEIASLYDRMHRAGFTHGSVARRNILMAPGVSELRNTQTNTPQWARSLQTPSFRVIDFGRGANVNDGSEEQLDYGYGLQRGRRGERMRGDLNDLQAAIKMRIPLKPDPDGPKPDEPDSDEPSSI